MDCSYINKKLVPNSRVVGSSSYAASMVANGKADICTFKNSAISPAFDLLIREAGGMCSINDGIFIGTNNQINEKIKR